jgi:hypothetical protein
MPTLKSEDGTLWQWSPNPQPPKPKFRIKRLPKPYKPYSLEEEVIGLVKEWYESRGQAVPEEDLEACKGIDAGINGLNPAPTEKPVYGTPEFWKQWRAKKLNKEPVSQQTPSAQESAKPTWLASRKKKDQQ